MACIYLSPSGQEFNPFLSGGTEEYYANLIADAIVPYLNASDICYERNRPWMTAQQSADNANVFNFDAYLAIHSNSAPPELSGLLRGCDIYYYPTSASGRRYAQITARYYRTIYPIPSRVNIVPLDTLIELNKTRAPAILVETGYHDNPQDEAWIKANIENIARVLARATAEFVGVPFFTPPPFVRGIVTTDGTGVNIRNAPDSSAAVIGRAANGSILEITCKCGLWYRLQSGGYVNAAYVIPENSTF
ncbi:MAG: peptidoglycan hydrolase [Ruminococcaceae bacterium]|nr:peptidoglycan hydrolase [Oscillospiraceae bacterium]